MANNQGPTQRQIDFYRKQREDLESSVLRNRGTSGQRDASALSKVYDKLQSKKGRNWDENSVLNMNNAGYVKNVAQHGYGAADASQAGGILKALASALIPEMGGQALGGVARLLPKQIARAGTLSEKLIPQLGTDAEELLAKLVGKPVKTKGIVEASTREYIPQGAKSKVTKSLSAPETPKGGGGTKVKPNVGSTKGTVKGKTREYKEYTKSDMSKKTQRKASDLPKLKSDIPKKASDLPKLKSDIPKKASDLPALGKADKVKNVRERGSIRSKRGSKKKQSEG
jgi:hypothetical protein